MHDHHLAFWWNTQSNVGLNDPSITANHPLANVHVKDGKRTYAAYNFGAEALNVNFSDGTVLVAKPRGRDPWR